MGGGERETCHKCERVTSQVVSNLLPLFLLCVCVSQIKGLEDEVSRLTSQISCLQAKVRVLHLIFFTSLSLSLLSLSLSLSPLSLSLSLSPLSPSVESGPAATEAARSL